MPSLKYFRSATLLTDHINAYFSSIGLPGNVVTVTHKPGYKKSSKKIAADTVVKNAGFVDCDPPTLTGLALFLGFDSLEEFELYENTGKHGSYLKRSRLIIIAAYEKKLHNNNASGAIFALKGLGWNKDNIPEQSIEKMPATLEIKIIESGPPPAANEKEVDLADSEPMNEPK